MPQKSPEPEQTPNQTGQETNHPKADGDQNAKTPLAQARVEQSAAANASNTAWMNPLDSSMIRDMGFSQAEEKSKVGNSHFHTQTLLTYCQD